MSRQIRSLCEFPYKPLKAHRHEIRLIQLEAEGHESNPSKSGRTLSAEVIHAERGRQPYTALSYAWGRNNNKAPLRIGDQKYYINETVEAALRQIQDKASDVFVWVDQICINQQNDVEKGHQVQQMKEIYSEAETVVAWLGPAEDGSDRLLRHLGRIGTFIWAGDYERVFAPHQNEEALEAIGVAFRFLCEREYWKRLWIMQEYAVANRLQIACGDVMIWDWQLQAVFVFVNKLSMNQLGGSSGGKDVRSLSQDIARVYKNPTASFMEGVVTRRTRYWSRKDTCSDSLFQVLITTLVLEQDYNYPLATDPRDRIFSVLQLARDKDEFRAFPDYTWTCERIFREAALNMLRQGHIDILAYCQSPSDAPDIPTWVPDWRMKIRSPCTGPPWINDFSASGHTLSQQMILSPSPGTVVLQGILVDSVEEYEDIWDPDWLKPLEYTTVRTYLDQIRALCQRSPTHSQQREAEMGLACLSIACCRNITNNMSSEIPADPYHAVLNQLSRLTARVQAPEDGRRAVAPVGPAALDSVERDTWSHLYIEQLRFLHSRRPSIFKTGSVGSIPSSAHSGDTLCIFLGAKIPYVIRPVRDNSEAYTLIGEAFVYGIMDGESLRSDYQVKSVRLQ